MSIHSMIGVRIVVLLQNARRKIGVPVVSAAARHRPSSPIRQQHGRFFVSFLAHGNSSSLLSPQPQGETSNAQRRHEHNTQTLLLLENALYRMSVQHAHPLGPWRAMSVAVQSHYDVWVTNMEAASTNTTITTTGIPPPSPLFRVLDLACGPRGQPGTTIARLLPLAACHCTDSCAQSVEQVPVFLADSSSSSSSMDAATTSELDDKEDDYEHENRQPRTPPKNLTKSVVDMSDLSAYPSNTFNAITCCYGYGLAHDVSHALSEAHRVLVPGGILVVATWDRSAMLSLGRDVLQTVKGGGRDPLAAEDDEAFLPPRLPPVDGIALAGPGELEALLAGAGFDHHPGAVVTTFGTYPFDMGSNADDIFAMGTILIRDELERLGALASADGGGALGNGSRGAGGWANLAEEAFWISVRKYATVVGGQTVLLNDNTFKMTVSTKSTTPPLS